MTTFFHDLRFAFRQLRKSPGFTAVAIITLAFGIGANTAIFSLINAIMLRTLPVKDPGSLVILKWVAKRPPQIESGSAWAACPAIDPPACSFSYPMFQQLRTQQQVLSGLFASVPTPTNVAINVSGHPGHANGLYVSGDFFATLGTHPLFGRLLTSADDSESAPVVTLSSTFWRKTMAGDYGVLGKPIMIGKRQFTIVGVAPSIELDPGVPQDVWMPLSLQPKTDPHPFQFTEGKAIWLQLIGRLKPGISPQQAAVAVSTIFAAGAAQGPDAIFSAGDAPHIELLSVARGLSSLRRFLSQPLFLLFAAVALVLLIACANIAGLMLARAAERKKEVAVRSALGATRGRLLRQFLTESLLLSASGGVAGCLLGYLGAKALAAFFTRNWWMPIAFDVHPDVRVLAFTFLAAAGVGLLFGAAPVFLHRQLSLAPVLKEGSGGIGGVRSGKLEVAGILVTAQMALAVVVLVGAGLLVRTLANLKHVEPGFDPRNLVIFGVDTTYRGSGTSDLQAFHTQIQSQLAALPGVTSVTYSEVPLLTGGGMQVDLYPENGTQPLFNVDVLRIARNFFQTMRMELLAGRTFNEQDLKRTMSPGPGAYQPVVINQTFAHRIFGNQNPIGRYFRQGSPTSPISEVVGVVADAKYDSLRTSVAPTIYALLGDERATFEVRTAIDPNAMMPAIRAAITRFDPNLLITDMKTQQEQIDQNIYQDRLIANLSSLFALLALIVACVGIYGLLSYQVTRRTQEIGIRLALGAQRADVLRIVLRQGMVLAIVGAVIGIAAALAVTRYLQSFLYGVKPNDPLTMIAVAFLLIAVALLASYIPARRAMNTDPMVALRYE